jgi:glutamine synthetase
VNADETLTAVKKKVKDADLKTIRLVFCNASGVPCSKAWSSAHLDDLLERGIEIFKGNYFMCLGVSQPPNSRFKIDAGDLNLIPDPETFELLPYLPRTGRFYGDLYDKDTGEPWECCARSLLRKTISDLEGEGYLCDTAGELEFYLLKRESECGHSRLVRMHEGFEALPFSTQGLDIASVFLDEAMTNLRLCGLDVTRVVKEGGPGQYEINLAHSQ